MEGRYPTEPANPEGGTGTADAGTRRGTARYSVPEAARALGISERAVRKRIEAGTLHAERVGRAWSVALSAVPLAVPGAETTVLSAPGAVPSAVPTAPVPPSTAPDLTPLVDHIARLEGEVRHLAEAATVWQVRAVQAEEQLKQLTAGDAIARAAPTDPSVTDVTKGRASDHGAL